MKRYLIILGAALGLYPLGSRGEDTPPAIAVTIESLGRRAVDDMSPVIIMAVWPEGKLVWSQDQTRGGPPFRTARIDPATTQAVLNRFEKEAVFKKEGFRHSWFGPDSSYHSIWLNSGGKRTKIETWHELFEANPKLVAINGGIAALDGRNREDVIRSDTKEFQAFRVLWTDLRTSITALIPGEGTPYAESLKLSLLPGTDEPKHNAMPKAGVVPNEATAIRIAVAVWEPIYGTDKIAAEKPFHAKLTDGVWTVEGSTKHQKGGVALAEISKADGRILRISHGK